MPDKVKTGVVGCGNISYAYFLGCRPYDCIEIAGCSDIDMARAEDRAKEFGVPKACTVEELLADDEIQIVVNLTTPQFHAEVNLAAIEAGKQADLVVLSVPDYRHLGYRFGTNLVEHVIKRGRIHSPPSDLQ